MKVAVANPARDMGFFSRAVVLILEHKPEGATGVVLGRPSSAKARDYAGEWGQQLSDAAPVWIGGPVGRDGVLGLAWSTRELPGRRVDGDVWLINLDADARAVGVCAPQEVLLFGGHSGWGPGQFDAECARGDWVCANAPSGWFLWPVADLARQVLRDSPYPSNFLATFPPDPSWN